MSTEANSAVPPIVERDEVSIVGEAGGESEVLNTEEVRDPIQDWVDPLPNKTLEELESDLRTIRTSNQKQAREIRMFQSYADRYKLAEPDEELEAEDITPDINRSQRQSMRKASTRTSSRRNKNVRASARGNKTKTRPWAHTLSATEKCQICTKELEHVCTEHKVEITKANKALAQFRAEIEVTELTYGELQKGILDLQKELSKHNLSAYYGESEPDKLTKERVTRGHREFIKARSNLIQKVMLRTSTLRGQLSVHEASFKAKEQSGEDLHAVDFERLKIQNSEFVEKLVVRNAELLKTKQKLLELGYLSDSYSGKISEQMKTYDKFRREISSMQALERAILKESGLVSTESASIKESNAMYKSRLKRFRAPPVMTYVQHKDEMRKMKYYNHQWGRRVKTAQAEQKRWKQMWKRLVRHQQLTDHGFFGQQPSAARILPPIVGASGRFNEYEYPESRMRAEQFLSDKAPLPPLQTTLGFTPRV